jgi:hypothetical protein
LFLSLFFATFLTGAGGVWLYDNRDWLGHQFNRMTTRPQFKIPSGPIPGLPMEPAVKLDTNMDWHKNWQRQNFNVSQFKFTPPKIPQIPQISVPRMPPPPPMRIRR